MIYIVIIAITITAFIALLCYIVKKAPLQCDNCGSLISPIENRCPICGHRFEDQV